MSATMNTTTFLPALTIDDQWQWRAVSLKDFQTAYIAAHEVEQYDLKTAAIIVDHNGEGWGPSSKSETWLGHLPVARAITLSSVH